MRKLFGTDGIRGVAGEYPLDDKTVFAIGRALGAHLHARHASPGVVIGQDTRESSSRIADTLAHGLASQRVRVRSAGIIPTPGIAYLARAGDFAAGIVVSASHNPWRDNGIKVFGHDGYKLPDEVELEIERGIFAELAAGSLPEGEGPRTLPGESQLRIDYEQWVVAQVEPNDPPLYVVVDCANGAASEVAQYVFGHWGVRELEFIHTKPDGRNINDNCGALHPEVVANEVVARGAGLGITFDGDADRALFADNEGNVVNGDAVMLLTARWLRQQGSLRGDTVVATTMSNMGLEVALQQEGIRMLRAPVGDKYVLEEMQKSGAVLGGEQSGHIIFLNKATTGDGLLTAATLLHILGETGKTLRVLTADLKVFPQVIRNVHVREKTPLDQVPEVAALLRAAEEELAGTGRVVVRYSGTEKLCRVMVEAADHATMNRHANAIADAVQRTLGV